MVDFRCWILDLRKAKCGVEIYGEIKAKFLGATESVVDFHHPVIAHAGRTHKSSGQSAAAFVSLLSVRYYNLGEGLCIFVYYYFSRCIFIDAIFAYKLITVKKLDIDR